MGGKQEPLAPPLVFYGMSKSHEGECLNSSGHRDLGGA